MTFTTLTFIFLFLPIALIAYYILRGEARNVFLVLISLVFYAFSEPVMILLLIASILVNYLFGLLLAKNCETAIKNLVFFFMLVWNFGFLFVYKYLGYTLSVFNLFGANFEIPSIVQPLGISFFTFRTVSFCLDVYWGTVPMQRNLTDVALYVSFFPQVAMGPISKYNDFASQIHDRKFDVDLFLDGVKRFIVGLSKKLIIADNIGPVVDKIFSMTGTERTVTLSWIGIVGYLIQLYYDFSGYSDMAIGIGQMFGFETPENFNYPYISKSVVEYWTRWHATLGTWLKNYLYTPIFRNCQEKQLSLGKCNVLALLGVWLFAGIWHGAGLNYLLYGIYYFVFIVIERLIEDYKKKRRKRLKLKKQPETLGHKIFSHTYFFFTLVGGQLLFRTETLEQFGDYFKSLFGMNHNGIWNSTTYYYWCQSVTLLCVGLLFCFPIVKLIRGIIKEKIPAILQDFAEVVVYAFLLTASMAFAMTNTYQTFVYFQF